MSAYRQIVWTAVIAGVVGCGGGGRDEPDAGDGVPIDAPVAVPDAPPDAGEVGPDAAVAPCELPAPTGAVATLAGCGDPGAGDGVRGVARFANPVNVLVTPGGEVVVADFDNGLLRGVAADGSVRTIVDRPGFARPFGLAMDGATLYVSTDDNDLGAHSPTTGTVWRVDLATGAATVVVRDVGRPRGLLALGGGKLVLSDYVHHTVSLLDVATGQVTPLAGKLDEPGHIDATGAAARFRNPYDVARLPDGRIAVADFGNHRLRAITLDGVVTTLAGSGVAGTADGPAASAQLGYPQALAADAAGRLYITDTDGFRIRVLDGGAISTLTGTTAGWLDGALETAQFHGLEGLALDPSGTALWIADGSRGEDVPFHRIRRVTLP